MLPLLTGLIVGATSSGILSLARARKVTGFASKTVV